MESAPTVDILLGDYDRFLRRRGRAVSTRLQYSYPLQCFATWIEDRPVAELTAGDLERFLSWWEEQFEARRGRSPRRATVRGTIGALRGFFDYLERTGTLVTASGTRTDNPMDQVFSPTHEQRPNDFLRTSEDTALLSCPCSDSEKTIVWLLRWAGLRVSEARAVTLEDIDLTTDAESLLIRTSKTSAGQRTVPIVPQLIPVIERRIWLLERSQMTSPLTPLLATSRGTPMTSTYIWRVVKRVCERAGIRVVQCTCASRRVTLHSLGCPRTVSGENRSRVSPHTLRRTFGSDLLNRGLRLEVVSRLLGHANTTITERAYAHLLGHTVRAELLRALAHERG